MQYRSMRQLGASVLLALVTVSVSAQNAGAMAGHAGPGSQKMHQQMMSGMQKMQSMPMSGDVDKDFAMMMREHHLQAVEMAKVQLEQGKSAELKAMARKIIADQQKEIAQFDKWLGANK
ncbi:DUF305 domain-containing protein [Ramlibacter sp.]|uniref:DUF305 domain-containing protein n=1 Tax=Ramlibacter sp. TaxID=1917967 RepID=UPI003D0BC501